MKTWVTPPSIEIPDKFKDAIGGHPLVAELLIRRGFDTIDSAQRFMNPALYTPASAYDLPDMEKAVKRVQRAIRTRERICIWGDFDADGQTSTALLVSALGQLGANVTHYIPNRHTEGHGVHTGKLEQLIDDGAQLIITCDTGIAAHDAVDLANERGVDVIITDHHQLPETLPEAHATVNPQRLPASHPLHTLPGVGCAYKLIEALYQEAGKSDDTEQFLDLVALGIVADVATQTGDTRYLLQKGLQVLRKTPRLGLQALYINANITPEHIDAQSIGFGIGPRMNALGRLGDANDAVEFLTTRDIARAEMLANRLEGLNNSRKEMMERTQEGALKQIEQNPALVDNFSVLILASEHWEGGIVGIVASRLVEKFNRPVILFRIEDGVARGSARSVEGVDITQAISQHQDMLIGFGGHTQAAGLSLPEDSLPQFRRAVSNTVRAMRDDADTADTLTIDGYVSLNDLSMSLVDDLARLAPFGAGNPSLMLATERVKVANTRQIGRTNKHLRLTVTDTDDNAQDIIWWNADHDAIPAGWFDVAYTIGINDYKGNLSLQVIWEDARPRAEPIENFEKKRDVEVEDRRDSPDPLHDLKMLRARFDDMVVWSEGDPTTQATDTSTRAELRPALVLVIWTAPPDLASLQSALKTVNPETVVLFGLSPRTDSVNLFLQRIGGAVKHVLSKYDGKTTYAQLCGVLAHHHKTVEAGLTWMVVRGHIAIQTDDGENLILSSDKAQAGGSKPQTTAILTKLLHETANFRSYFKKADAYALIRI